MSHQSVPELLETFRARLKRKHYGELPWHNTLELVMTKRTASGLWIAIISDGTHSTDEPATIFKRVGEWVLNQVGNMGGGVLLFLYDQPAAAMREDIEKFGTSQFFAGLHDLHTGRHWLSNTMGWEQELYSDS